jgi:hypothetical protein
MVSNAETFQSKTSELIVAFVEAVNHQNITKIVMGLSENTIFCNSQGKEISGKENVIRAWMNYFELFSDYYIEVDQIIENDHTAVILGYSGGTYKKSVDDLDKWRLPSAWKVKLNNSEIAQWQVYTDNMVPFEIIKRKMRGNG